MKQAENTVEAIETPTEVKVVQKRVIESRKERRAKARKEKTAFEPQYNNSQANTVTYEEFHGVGYERFNSKHVIIKKIEAEDTN